MDTPETFAAALLASAGSALFETRKVVQKGAQNIKAEWKANVEKSAPVHNAHAANAITYDTGVGITSIDAVIGYDKDKRGGSLGNILEYGTSKQAGHRDGGRAADNEEPRFEQALTVMATGLLN